MNPPSAEIESDEFLDSVISGASQAARDIRAHIFRVNKKADEVRRILILGEAGSGKSFVAETICAHHCWLQRAFRKREPNRRWTDKELDELARAYVQSRGADILEHSGIPFANVLVPTLEGDLGLSELFGHKKGAFTGAFEDKEGYFGNDDFTHVFLDEIGYASKTLQQRLLQICSNGVFHALGNDEELRSDKRIIFATNQDLKRAATEGHFQQDLYWRMLNYVIEIPPLRDRREEIAGMIERWIDQLKREVLKDFGNDSAMNLEEPDLKWAVDEYAWPGNVRELEHTVKRWFLYRAGPDLTRIPQKNIRAALKATRPTRTLKEVCAELRPYLPLVSEAQCVELNEEAAVRHFARRIEDAARTGNELASPPTEIGAVLQNLEQKLKAAFVRAVARAQRKDPRVVKKAFGGKAGAAHVKIAGYRKTITDGDN